MKYLVLFLSSWCIYISSSCQRYPFELTGKIEGIDTGSVEIFKVVGGGKYTDISLNSRIAEIANGEFKFSGTLAYPHALQAFFVAGTKRAHTEMFFIEKGKQHLVCSIDTINYKTPIVIGSKVNEEFVNKFVPFYKIISDGYESVVNEDQKLYKKYDGKVPQAEKDRLTNWGRELGILYDSIINKYITQNPSSYVGLWQLIERFSPKGYRESYEASASLLSSSLKKTKSGTALIKGLKEAKLTSIGKTFPIINLLSMEGSLEQIKHKPKRFTLIDFWYSHCGPCIAEFPALKETYESFKDKNLTIVGISIDTENDKNDWLNAIPKHGLNWKQLWDKNGAFAKSIYVNSFPTTFLLDSEGKILFKNIKQTELKKFLTDNLQ